MKLPSKENFIDYLKKQATGQFIGFYIGLSSSGLVSRFFETRSFSNMWGLFAKKTLIDEGTFNILEKIIAVIIGFIVFEIVSRNLQPLIDRVQPVIKAEVAGFAKAHDLDARTKALLSSANKKRIIIFNAINTKIRNGIKKYVTR